MKALFVVLRRKPTRQPVLFVCSLSLSTFRTIIMQQFYLYDTANDVFLKTGPFPHMCSTKVLQHLFFFLFDYLRL